MLTTHSMALMLQATGCLRPTPVAWAATEEGMGDMEVATEAMEVAWVDMEA